MWTLVLILVPLVTALAGPVTALTRRGVLWSPSGARKAGAARAATVVVAVTATGTVVLGVLVTLAQFLGAGLSYSDARDGIPVGVRVGIWIGAWTPVALVVGALLASRVARRFRAVFVIGLVAPAAQLLLWVLVAAAVSVRT